MDARRRNARRLDRERYRLWALVQALAWAFEGAMVYDKHVATARWLCASLTKNGAPRRDSTPFCSGGSPIGLEHGFSMGYGGVSLEQLGQPGLTAHTSAHDFFRDLVIAGARNTLR